MTQAEGCYHFSHQFIPTKGNHVWSNNILWNKFYLTLKSHMIRYDMMSFLMFCSKISRHCFVCLNLTLTTPLLLPSEAGPSAVPPCCPCRSRRPSPPPSRRCQTCSEPWIRGFLRRQRWENMEKIGLIQENMENMEKWENMENPKIWENMEKRRKRINPWNADMYQGSEDQCIT